MEESMNPLPLAPADLPQQEEFNPMEVNDSFCEPTEEESQWVEELVGRRISVFWDGDQVFYPALVTRYDEAKEKFLILYEGDEGGREYVEDLRNVVWKIDRAAPKIEPPRIDLEPYDASLAPEPTQPLPIEDPVPAPATSSSQNKNPKAPRSSNKPPSYTSMVVDAVIALNEKNGSSLNAIRKFLLANYNIVNKQTASFNSLTLKAVNKAVASNELEKIKHSFKLTSAEKDRRREAEKKALGISGLNERSLSFGRRRSSVFTVDDFLNEGGDVAVTGGSGGGRGAGRNKALRKELLDFRAKRDMFLRRRLSLIRPFLPEKDYFSRRDREAQELKELRKAKKLLEDKQRVTAASLSLLGLDSETLQTLEEVPIAPDHVPDMYEQAAAPGVGNGAGAGDVAEVTEGLVASSKKASGAAGGEIAKESKKDMTFTEEIQGGENKAGGEVAVSILDESTVLTSTLCEVDTVEIPSIINATLHDHQVVGISWMVHMYKNGMPMILGDQMGLGKTLQTIGFLAYLHTALNKPGPHLIVVPLSVLSNWLSEIENFCPTFRAVRFHGPKSERDRIKSEELNDPKEFDMVITTYEIFVSEVNFFRCRYIWTSVVIDEGHRLKNEKSIFSEKIRTIPCLCKVILTGTPLQNNLHELWALLFYLCPDIFSSSEAFDQGFDLTRGVIDSSVLRRARKLLGVFMLRRLKDMVSIRLPSRKEVTLLVSLTPYQKELYRQLLCGLDEGTIEVVMSMKGDAGADISGVSRVGSSLAIADGVEENKALDVADTNTGASEAALVSATAPSSSMNDTDWRKLMNLLLQLRKICNHPYLLAPPFPYEVTEDVVCTSGKLVMLDRMLPIMQADNHRVLIFSQFTSMLDILEDYCELREYSYVRLDGETNRVKRRLDVRRFNAPNSNLFIFLISTRAGGLGLNLASADTVILYDSDWNPQVDLQAMERAHRIGQTKPVRVFRLVCRGSIEERMVSRAEKKLFLNAMVAETHTDNQGGEGEAGEGGGLKEGESIFQALGIGGGTGMSKAELASLIRFGANAVVDGDGDGEGDGGDGGVSDEELYKLLERQGRDKPYKGMGVGAGTEVGMDIESGDAKSAIANAAGTEGGAEVADQKNEEEDTFQHAQKVLHDRMARLQEVDLRQLGSFIYKKKDKAPGVGGGLGGGWGEGVLEGKRVRKERVVMVEGKGSGYGGAVPMLVEHMTDAGDASGAVVEVEEKVKSRGRQWVHRTFCTLCGLNVPPNLLTKCAHCPFVFHTQCVETGGEGGGVMVTKGQGMFICPHHRCSACDRSTSAAGGLLFRCTGCLTSYCEDCLPQDNIESLGRCRLLEGYGYHSQQAYYIRCPSCCVREGLVPGGVLANVKKEGDKTEKAPETEEGEADEPAEDEDKGEEGGEEGEEDGGDWVTLPTMTLRVQWHLIPDPPPPSPKKKGSKKKRSRGGAQEGSEDEGGSDAEGDGKKKKKGKMVHVSADDLTSIDIPDPCSLSQGMALVAQHDALQLLCGVVQPTHDPSEDFASVFAKVEAGRYRSAGLFVSDLRYAIEGRVVRKMQELVKGQENAPQLKEKITQCTKLLLDFIQKDLEPCLAL